jgi:hypothetical protein
VSRTSAQFTGRYRKEEYPDHQFGEDETPLGLLDRDERNGRVSFIHKTFPLTALFVSAEASNYGFRNATYKDSRRRWVGAGFQYDSGRSRIRLEAGPATLDFDDPTQHDFSGAIGTLRMTRLNGRWTYAAGATRDVGFTIVLNNNYYVADSVTAGVDYAATRRLSLRANVRWLRPSRRAISPARTSACGSSGTIAFCTLDRNAPRPGRREASASS